MSLDQLPGLIDASLDRYLTKDKKVGMTNELCRLSYTFSDLMAKNPLTYDGGPTLKFDALVKGGTAGGFVAPMTVRDPKLTQHTVRGEIDWSFYEKHITVEETEQALNGGDTKIFDVYQTRMEAMTTEGANELEATWLDSIGNIDHVGDEAPVFPGLKQFITRDGLAIDGSATKFGISTTTYPRWLNRYMGPLGGNLNANFDHDTNQTITSGNDLVTAIEKMFRFTGFKAPKGAQMAKDDSARDLRKTQKIYCDEIGYSSLQKLQKGLGHGDDQIRPAELMRDAPTIFQIAVEFIEDLGLGSGGIPTEAAHASRGSTTLTAADYANTGEIYFLNTAYWWICFLEGWNPKRKPTAFLELQQCLWTLFRWILTPFCKSLSRQGVIWGFSPVI